MKNLLKVLLFALVLQSCSLPSYTYIKPKQTGVDFTKGQWLLYNIESPAGTIQAVEKRALEDFGKVLGNRLVYYPESKGLMIRQNLSTNLSKSAIREIKAGTGLDYFIILKTGTPDSSLGAISFTQNAMTPEQSNSGSAELEIYDLNAEMIIYEQKVVGTTTRTRDGEDVHLSKTARDLCLGAYKKLMSDVMSKSVVK